MCKEEWVTLGRAQVADVAQVRACDCASICVWMLMRAQLLFAAYPYIKTPFYFFSFSICTLFILFLSYALQSVTTKDQPREFKVGPAGAKGSEKEVVGIFKVKLYTKHHLIRDKSA